MVNVDPLLMEYIRILSSANGAGSRSGDGGAVEELRELRGQNQQLQQQVMQLQSQQVQLQNQLLQLQAQNQHLQNQADKLQAEKEELARQNSALAEEAGPVVLHEFFVLEDAGRILATLWVMKYIKPFEHRSDVTYFVQLCYTWGDPQCPARMDFFPMVASRFSEHEVPFCFLAK